MGISSLDARGVGAYPRLVRYFRVYEVGKNTICELRDPEEGPIQRSGRGEDRFDFLPKSQVPGSREDEKSKDVPGKREMTEYFRF